MGVVDTQIFPDQRARETPFNPTMEIPAQDVQEAIQRVQANLEAADAELKTPEYLVATASATLDNERVTTDTPTVEWDHGTAAQAKANVPDNAITDAKIRQSAALSVLARAVNSIGNIADVVAAANDRIFRRVGDALDFGQLTPGMFPSTLLDTDGTLAANSDTRIASQKATKTYVDQIIAAQDAMVFKGVIDCSANPSYPAADRGHTYRVSVAGKIGGGSGPNVEVGDLLLCLTDATASGDHATVGANWCIAQTNLDGAVIGPASATDSHFAQFDGVSGKLLKGGLALDTDGTLAANSDTRLASQKAVKTYADTKMSGAGAVTDENPAVFDGITGRLLKQFTYTTLLTKLAAFTGDSGSGGVKGLVPAPASGDAAAGKFLKADGTFAVPAGGSTGLPAGHIYGLTLSNNATDATNDIDIAAGRCRDSTNTVDIIFSSAVGKQLDADWTTGGTPGSTVGGRNSGAAITNTTYHVYAVAEAAGANPEIYIHASATVATVLTALQAETSPSGANYIYARRIGSIVRSGGSIVGFVQDGDSFWLKVPVRDYQTGSTGTAAVSQALSVPLGIVVVTMLYHEVFNNGIGANVFHLVTSLDQTDTAPSTTVHTVRAFTNVQNTSLVRVKTNTSGQIRLRSDTNNANALWTGVTHGWIDRRGQDGGL